MKDRAKKTRGAEAGAVSLNPPDAALLQEQVTRLRGALEAGEPLEVLQGLVEVRSDDPDWDLQLLRELEKIPHAAVPPLLAALFGGSPDKTRQKALKRALHVLKSRGVQVPDDLLPREQTATLTDRAELVFQGYVSPLLGDGESFVLLEGPREVMEGNFLVARLSDQKGLVECHLLNVSRRQREELWNELREQGLGELAPVPPAYALSLLEEALVLTPDGEASREDYLPLREPLWRHLGRPGEFAPPEELDASLSPADRLRLLEDSRGLTGDMWFRSWVPGLAEITPWLEKVKEVQASPLVLSEQQQRLRLDGVVDQAVADLFPADSRARWSRRLLKMAAYLHFRGRAEDAQAARVAGEDLVAPDRGSLAGENPLLQELVRLALLLAGEVRRQQQEAPTASGLILPPTAPLVRR